MCLSAEVGDTQKHIPWDLLVSVKNQLKSFKCKCIAGSFLNKMFKQQKCCMYNS